LPRARGGDHRDDPGEPGRPRVPAGRQVAGELGGHGSCRAPDLRGRGRPLGDRGAERLGLAATPEPLDTSESGSPEGDAGIVRRVGINSAWLILQPLLLNFITLVAMGYITRRLGDRGYGMVNRGFAYLVLFAPIANLGLRTVGVRAMAERREEAPRIFATFAALRLALALLVAALAVATAF